MLYSLNHPLPIARIHQHIQRQRKDFHYKTAHKLVRNYDLIAVEDLQVRNLAKNSKLAKSILDAYASVHL